MYILPLPRPGSCGSRRERSVSASRHPRRRTPTSCTRRFASSWTGATHEHPVKSRRGRIMSARHVCLIESEHGFEMMDLWPKRPSESRLRGWSLLMLGFGFSLKNVCASTRTVDEVCETWVYLAPAQVNSSMPCPSSQAQ